MHMFQHYLSYIFEELARFDVQSLLRVNTVFERCINLAPSKRYTRHPLAQNIRAQYLSNFRISQYERSTIV